MTKLPSVTIEALCLSDLFFNYHPGDVGEDEMGTHAAAKDFIDLAGLEELVADFKARE
jgi:hypothetical protein